MGQRITTKPSIAELRSQRSNLVRDGMCFLGAIEEVDPEIITKTHLSILTEVNYSAFITIQPKSIRLGLV